MKLSEVRLSAPTVLVIAVVSAAAAYAAARGGVTTSDPVTVPEQAPPASFAPSTPGAFEGPSDLPPGHPAVPSDQGAPSDLPPGHPVVDPLVERGTRVAEPGEEAAKLGWKTPPRWEKVPNPSSMRLATYRIPHAAGDAEDPELSVSQAGGSVEANAQRWIDQFDAEARKGARRTTRKVNDLDVTIVEVEGTFGGGMSKDRGEEEGFMLLGAIVATRGMPHFFKLTGPAKSVKAARSEFDALVASISVPPS
jgi:hypothetical protein